MTFLEKKKNSGICRKRRKILNNESLQIWFPDSTKTKKKIPIQNNGNVVISWKGELLKSRRQYFTF